MLVADFDVDVVGTSTLTNLLANGEDIPLFEGIVILIGFASKVEVIPTLLGIEMLAVDVVAVFFVFFSA